MLPKRASGRKDISEQDEVEAKNSAVLIRNQETIFVYAKMKGFSAVLALTITARGRFPELILDEPDDKV